MTDFNSILQTLTLGLLAVGAYLLFLMRTATEAAVKTSAEEGVKAALRTREWRDELARELQKSRGVERQELRFQSYGGLWTELRPLAIYDRTPIDKTTVGVLAETLTNWYFSKSGGLLLTPHARDFYFALQDLLRATSNLPSDWRAERSGQREGDAERIFLAVLEQKGTPEAVNVFRYFRAGAFDEWQEKAVGFGRTWRDAVRRIGEDWDALDERERFAILQQVGSKLRTSLVNDLESRLR